MLTNLTLKPSSSFWAISLFLVSVIGLAEPDSQTKTNSLSSNAEANRLSVSEGRSAVAFYRGTSEVNVERLQLAKVKKSYPVASVERLQPLIELGDPFLGNGPIRPGLKTPFGQMLQPSFLLFGSLRSGVQTSKVNHLTRSEWSNRLDLIGNLNLSGTEHILIALRPLDSEASNTTGYNFQANSYNGWHDDFNLRITRLFFEGDFGEIFQGLDPSDSHTFDIGFSVGRQRMVLQDGVLINDIVDMVGITRNSLVFDGISNLRLTGFYGWNHINRGNNVVTDSGAVVNNTHSADLFGLSAEADTALDNTVNFDLLYVLDKHFGNSFYLGASSTQRFGGLNTTFRINASLPEQGETANSGRGVLLLSQLSTNLPETDNLLYFNSFWNIGRFTSAARSPDQGTPVANMGILFSPVGLGNYGVPLGQSIDNTIGASVGYQMFLDGIDRQVIFELGGRVGTQHTQDYKVIGLGARFQQTIANRHVLRLDTFVSEQENVGFGYGVRTEWMIKF